MSQYASIAQSLTEALNLRVPPIAICLTDTPPAGVAARSGPATAGCFFWEEGSQKSFSTSAADHQNCVVGMYTHHMPISTPEQQADLNDCLQVFGDLGYVRPEDLPKIPVLENEPKHVVYSPLAEAPAQPEVVLLLADAQQGLILTEAAQQAEDGVPPVLGRPACAVVPQVANTGKAAMSLGCCGARAYMNVLRDDIGLWAFPGAKIEAYAERIAALAKANQILTQFHQLRRKDIESGQHPSIKDSLVRLQG